MVSIEGVLVFNSFCGDQTKGMAAYKVEDANTSSTQASQMDLTICSVHTLTANISHLIDLSSYNPTEIIVEEKEAVSSVVCGTYKRIRK